LIRGAVLDGRSAAGSGSDLQNAVDSVWPVAAGVAPELSAEAAVTRYVSYLEYLDGLTALYSSQLGAVDLASFRRAVGGRV
jgi:hypothetical protein